MWANKSLIFAEDAGSSTCKYESWKIQDECWQLCTYFFIDRQNSWWLISHSAQSRSILFINKSNYTNGTNDNKERNERNERNEVVKKNNGTKERKERKKVNGANETEKRNKRTKRTNELSLSQKTETV